MAHFAYALAGTGSGHASRGLAVAEGLRARGHRVTFCTGGPNAADLQGLGQRVLAVPFLKQIIRGNRVALWATARANARWTVRAPDVIAALGADLDRARVDAVVCDFEPFAPYAARRLGLPVVSLDHQQVVSACRYPVRPADWASAAGTALGIRILAPRAPQVRVISSFYRPPLWRPGTAHFVGPILRREVLKARPTQGDHVLVYFNAPEGLGPVLQALGQTDARFVVYNAPPDATAPPNVTLKPFSREGFVADLASARGVVCSAGFTLLSEALYLGKPVLAVPNRGFFEQALNAQALERSGRGEAVYGAFSAEAVRAFLDRLPAYRSALSRDPVRVGNDRAVAYVESALKGPRRPRQPLNGVSPELPSPSLCPPGTLTGYADAASA